MADFFTRKRERKIGDVGGMLRLWLMLDTMEKYPISGLAILFWKSRLKAIGWGPRRCFTVYLNECPVFTETAPEEF